MYLTDHLLTEGDRVEKALDSIVAFARAVSRGEAVACEPMAKLLAVLRRSTHAGKLNDLLGARIGSRHGEVLLSVLAETVGDVGASPCARRQFFHAARAFVALRRASLADERGALDLLAKTERKPEEDARLRLAWSSRDHEVFDGAECGDAIAESLGAIASSRVVAA